MKKGRYRFQGFIAGLLVVLLLLPLGMALASPDATVTRTISVAYRNIQIVVNGERITPRDAQGRIVEPFIFNGTTFLPVRAVSEALGKTVDWDGPTSTVYIGGRPQTPTPPSPPQTPTPPQLPANQAFLQVAPSYEQSLHAAVVNTIAMGGTTFGQSLRFRFPNTNIISTHSMHNLQGQFSTLSGYIGRVDGTHVQDATINFIGDGRLLESFTIVGESLPRRISVNVSSVHQLRIEVLTQGGMNNPPMFAFADGVLS